MEARWLRPFRFTLRLATLLVHIVVGIPVTVLCIGVGRGIRVGDRGLDEFMLNAWSRGACRIFGIRLAVEGAPAAPPVLVVSNHISWLDIEVLHAVAAMGFVGKAEIRGWPVVGRLATIGGTIFHERGSRHSADDVATALAERLKQGRRVAIFPEGGILPGDHVKRFHARLFKAAVETGSPVQPVMIRYVRNGRRDPGVGFHRHEHFVGNIARLLARPGCTAQVRFMAPMPSAGKPRRALADAACDQVREAFEEPVTAEP